MLAISSARPECRDPKINRSSTKPGFPKHSSLVKGLYSRAAEPKSVKTAEKQSCVLCPPPANLCRQGCALLCWRATASPGQPQHVVMSTSYCLEGTSVHPLPNPFLSWPLQASKVSDLPHCHLGGS